MLTGCTVTGTPKAAPPPPTTVQTTSPRIDKPRTLIDPCALFNDYLPTADGPFVTPPAPQPENQAKCLYQVQKGSGVLTVAVEYLGPFLEEMATTTGAKETNFDGHSSMSACAVFDQGQGCARIIAVNQGTTLEIVLMQPGVSEGELLAATDRLTRMALNFLPVA
jgi:hypothetical protein